jgi:hypothetical protein
MVGTWAGTLAVGREASPRMLSIYIPGVPLWITTANPYTQDVFNTIGARQRR